MYVVRSASVRAPSTPAALAGSSADETCQRSDRETGSNESSIHHGYLDICFEIVSHPLLKTRLTVSYNEAMAQDETQLPAVAFEASLDELERVVKELEKGELTLERSLELFEKGIKLTEQCKKQLEEAETRVELLVKRGAKTVAVPFDPTQENPPK
jgi:exodeoxyribonuclease VII small subunit